MTRKKNKVGPFLLRVVANAVALWVAAWVLPGMDINAAAAEATGAQTVGPTTGTTAGGVVGIIVAYLLLGLVFGLLNATIRPFLGRISMPVTILTLGLFALVLNAAMLALTAWISSYTPVHLTIDSFFWTAILGAIIVSIVSSLVGAPLGAGHKRPKLAA